MKNTKKKTERKKKELRLTLDYNEETKTVSLWIFVAWYP